MSDEARHDGRALPGLLDTSNTGSGVRADTAYGSQKNEKRITAAGLISKIHFRRAPGTPLPANRQRANAARSGAGSAIGHAFADQKHRMGGFVRTIGIARARTRIGLANLVYNLRRHLHLETAAAAAAQLGVPRSRTNCQGRGTSTAKHGTRPSVALCGQ
ncbi:hypothetical protein LNKW23_08460 [Paralimibaculum aggregatum]|uniref:Transposase n=1 Tax=Paralimibaculum aggregatum TaxID=3036245 RepID=A0ABQ6LE64_9RHOB|nr:hypothetical protein LNKW23_08460 [Limibaculum sp. NKW23]